MCAGVPSEVAERLKALERENRDLRQANDILRKASAYFAQAELDRRFKPRSCSSTITARRTGSSRSARCCRSPRQPTTTMWPGGAIRPGCRHGRSGIWLSRSRSGASSKRTSGSTACARCGGNCSGKASMSLAARVNPGGKRLSFPKTLSADPHDANRPGVDEVFERDRR